MVYSAVATFAVVWVLLKYGAVFTWLSSFDPAWVSAPLSRLRRVSGLQWLKSAGRLACVCGAVAVALMPVRSERPATNIAVFLGAASAAASFDALPAAAVCLVAGGTQLVEGGYGISGQVLAAIGMMIFGACVTFAWSGQSLSRKQA